MKDEIKQEIKLTKEFISKFNSKKLEGLFKHYSNYITIRRNFREAYDLISYVIKNEKEIKKNNLSNNESLINIISACFFHSVILYTRWFKKTNNKLILKKNDFFQKESLIKDHDNFIKLRDKYIAHNESNVLGGDLFFYDPQKKELKSSYVLRPWDEPNKIKQLIEIAHNKIDKEILPKKEENLKKELENIINKH